MNSSTQDFLMKMSAEYTADLTLPTTYTYLDGEPIRPIVPTVTSQGGIFIIGAYPTARFATIGPATDVPVADINEPFSNESYYDGRRLREVKSGVELDDHYLKPLGIFREQCWITNLVKIFLFKEGHIRRYRKLGYTFPDSETRSHFENYVQQGLSWLIQELLIAAPKVIFTLGTEVAGILQGVRGRIGRNKLLGGDLKSLKIGSYSYTVIHFAHPGIIMRASHDKTGRERNPWPRLHREEHLPVARSILKTIL